MPKHPFEHFTPVHPAGDTLTICDDQDPFPLKDFEFPVQHGELSDHKAEDGAQMEVFVGTHVDGYTGYVVVYSPFNTSQRETLMYVDCTRQEELDLIEELRPIVRDQGRFKSLLEAEKFLEPHKDKTIPIIKPPKDRLPKKDNDKFLRGRRPRVMKFRE